MQQGFSGGACRAGTHSAPSRNVAAAAKRRGLPRKGSSTAGGGGRGRSAPRDRDRAAVKELSFALTDTRRKDGTNGGFGGNGSGSDKSKKSARRGSDNEESDGDTEWDEELLADLSDSEVAELLGEPDEQPDPLAACEPQLRSDVEAVLSQFTFTLDRFQVQAVTRLLAGKSVVVCAPTGAGKTAIAEAASLHFLARGQRVIYTTPLKALSNQKLGEMRERFGVGNAGLQTGDASLNIDAPIVVMTTEILRNMLYRVDDGGRPQTDRLKDVGLVVLDEVHYLGDPGRGSVWEEVIISLPPHIQLLSMSATVRNPEDLGGWISEVHRECETIRTAFRPVPLTWHFCHSTGPPPDAEEGGPPAPPARLLQLLDGKGRKINPALLPPSKRFELQDVGDEEWGRWDESRGRKGRTRALRELLGDEGDDDWHFLPRWKRIPSLDAVVRALRSRAMLPAIWFIFSRKECDLAARALEARGLTLTAPEERQQIQAELDALAADQPEAVKGGFTEALLSGVASHHAGCLPAWKGLIERLFQRGLLKLVFATETLAAGINMPARTTLVAALSRRRDGTIVSLQHNELLQMAGRAGRRGYDTVGHCVVLQSKWEDAEVAWDILRRGPEPLRSQFSTGYGMVLNLLATRPLSAARAFLDRSFARYTASIGSQRRLAEAARLEEKAAALMEEVSRRAGVSANAEALWTQYQKLQGRLKEEKRASKLLRAQLAKERAALAEVALERLGLPRIVGLDLSASNLADSDYRLPALLVCKLERSLSGVWIVEGGADYLCLGADNKLYQVNSRHISSVLESGHPLSDDAAVCGSVLRFARELRSRGWVELSSDVGVAEGTVVTAMAASKLLWPEPLTPLLPSADGLAAMEEQRQRVRDVKEELRVIKADRGFMRAARALNTQAAKAGALLERAAALRAEVEAQAGGDWRAFEDFLAILQEAGALTEATDEGALQPAAESGLVPGAEAASLAGTGSTVSGSSDSEGEVLLASSSSSSSSGDAPRLGGGSGDGRVGFTPLGVVAREVNCSNELWMALVLTHSAVQTLEPATLAGVLSAVIASEAVSRPTLWTAYSASERVAGAVAELEDVRQQLAGLQARYGVDAPLPVDLRLAGLVEAWASGCSWDDVMQDCSLDDGDVARLLTRTVDLLKQVAYCTTLLPQLRKAARAAVAAMDRKPISDLVA